MYPEGSILPHVSVHAMTGLYDFRIMRVATSVKGKAVHVLIDTGSTQNFLDLDSAKSLGCALTSIVLFLVFVVDGKKIQSNYLCKAVIWKMQRVSFESAMFVLPTGSCNSQQGVTYSVVEYTR